MRKIVLFIGFVLLSLSSFPQTQEEGNTLLIDKCPAPLFRDPVFDGAADPVVIWNRQEKEWVLLYTQRRANIKGWGLAWAHGTSIGIATSKDGVTWLYRGTPEGLNFEKGHNTFWMAEAIYDEGTYHFWIVYKQGFSSTWAGNPKMMHYTSKNIWEWNYEGPANFNEINVVENNVWKMPDGKWRSWYKTVRPNTGFGIYVSESTDLINWTPIEGKAFEGPNNEGAHVFFWKGYYWLITDEWKGIAIYRSPDGDKWTHQPYNLLKDPGKREEDQNYGGNPYAIVQEGRAFIIYHTHPGWEHKTSSFWREATTYKKRRSVIQIAELELKDNWLVCDRDKYLKKRY